MEIEKLSLDELVLAFAKEGALSGIARDDIFLTTKYMFTLSIEEAVHIMKELAENFSKSWNYGILRARLQMDQKNWYMEFGYKTATEQLDPSLRSAPNQSEILNYFATVYFLEQKSDDRKVTLIIDYLRTSERENAILNLMRVVYSAHKKIKTPSET